MVLGAMVLAGGVEAAPVSFSRDLAPILADKCLACHQEGKAKGQYQVDNYEQVLKEGDSAVAPIVAGKPHDGLFFQRLVTDDESERMPQKDDPLPPEQIELFRRWLAEGAKFDGESPQTSLADLARKGRDGSGVQTPEKYPNPLPVTAIAWLPDEKHVAVSGYGEVTVWERETGKLHRRVKQQPERIFALSMHPGGKLLAVAGGTPGKVGEVSIVDLTSGKTVQRLPTVKDTVLSVVFSPDGLWLASGSADNGIRVFRVSDWKPAWAVTAHADWVTGLAFSPDSKLLASASRDRTSRTFLVANGETGITQTSHGSAVTGVTFDRDGKSVITCASDGEVRRWRVEGGSKGKEVVLVGRRREATRVAVWGSRLVVASVDGRLRSFDLAKEKDPAPMDLPPLGARVEALSFGTQSGILAAGGQGGRLVLVQSDPKNLLRQWIASPGW